MKKRIITLLSGMAMLAGSWTAHGQTEIIVDRAVVPGNAKPIYLNLTGLTGEAAQVLQFDLYVQGFAFTNADQAQYLITGSNNGSLTARATDKFNRNTLVAKSYSGGTLRRQVHTFADEFVEALKRKGIARTKVAFKVDTGKNSEIFVADFDGFGPQAVTSDNVLVKSPAWAPGKLALYYTSYKLNNPDIYYHDLSSGSRKVFARYGGSNMSPAVSPDGTKVAMILSKDGWTDLYVGDADGGNVKRLTRSRQDESSPCWSHDGRFIIFAGKIGERRALCRIPAEGGEVQRIPTDGVSNPTEPECSPDGQWIVFTSMARGFDICVVPAKGGAATPLVAGEDPSWAPNSRTVIFSRRQGSNRVLSLLDVPTKQYKDISRISGSSGSSSQPSWAR
jgi:TolB protein